MDGMNKVELVNPDGSTDVLVDLTADTVTEDELTEGTTAHDATGRAITGRARYAPVVHTHSVEDIEDFPDIDDTATNGSANLVTSGAAYTAGYNARQYARSSNSTSKLFVLGATSQSARVATNSNVNVYIDGNHLYSNGKKVVNDEFTRTYQNFGNQTIGTSATWTTIATKSDLAAGKYLIMAYCMTASATNGRYMCRICKNGSEITEFGCRASYDSTSGAWGNFTAFAFAEIAAGDTITIEGYVSVAGTTINCRPSTLKLS